MSLCFGASQERSADHCRTGAQDQGGCDASSIRDSTGSDDRHIKVIREVRKQREESHGLTFSRRLIE
jgi:hypothetical protein